MRTLGAVIHRLAGAAALLASVCVGGCGWLFGTEGYFRDRGDDYRDARSIPPMQSPEGKQPDAIEPLYAIPVDRTDTLLGESFEVPRPAPLVGEVEQDVVRIQKLGNEQWILLDGAPGQVWPRIRAFLISNQIGIEREDAAKGLMETSWLAFKDDPTRREKYRYRVDQGIQRNSTEVYVTQMAYTRPDGAEPEPPAWRTRSMDPERESWMVKELATYLADTGDDASVSLLAQGISTVNKVYIVRDAANRPVIDLRLPFERAWASLGRALPRAEFRVQDLDRSAGTYFVTYEPGLSEEGAEGKEPKKKGLFSGLFGWWGDDDENPAAGRAYRVQVRDEGETVIIGVRREDGSDFDEGEGEFLLGLIKAHLA